MCCQTCLMYFQALVDQLLLREGRVLKKGWLTFYDLTQTHGEKRYFVLRDKSFLYFEDESVQDPGDNHRLQGCRWPVGS